MIARAKFGLVIIILLFVAFIVAFVASFCLKNVIVFLLTALAFILVITPDIVLIAEKRRYMKKVMSPEAWKHYKRIKRQTLSQMQGSIKAKYWGEDKKTIAYLIIAIAGLFTALCLSGIENIENKPVPYVLFLITGVMGIIFALKWAHLVDEQNGRTQGKDKTKNKGKRKQK